MRRNLSYRKLGLKVRNIVTGRTSFMRHNILLDNRICVYTIIRIIMNGSKPMPLTLYTKNEDKPLIEEMKIKALKEKTSLSEVAFHLLRMWVRGEINIRKKSEVGK